MRGTNATDTGPLAIVATAEETAAFDALGPLTRDTLRNAPFKVLAAPILKEARQHGLDPCDPGIDAQFAANLKGGMYNALLEDREPADAALGVRPLQARRLRRAR